MFSVHGASPHFCKKEPSSFVFFAQVASLLFVPGWYQCESLMKPLYAQQLSDLKSVHQHNLPQLTPLMMTQCCSRVSLAKGNPEACYLLTMLVLF